MEPLFFLTHNPPGVVVGTFKQEGRDAVHIELSATQQERMINTLTSAMFRRAEQ